MTNHAVAAAQATLARLQACPDLGHWTNHHTIGRWCQEHKEELAFCLKIYEMATLGELLGIGRTDFVRACRDMRLAV